jgi:hypothetical protein
MAVRVVTGMADALSIKAKADFELLSDIGFLTNLWSHEFSWLVLGLSC